MPNRCPVRATAERIFWATTVESDIPDTSSKQTSHVRPLEQRPEPSFGREVRLQEGKIQHDRGQQDAAQQSQQSADSTSRFRIADRDPRHAG